MSATKKAGFTPNRQYANRRAGTGMPNCLFSLFLVADAQLYERLCPSVGTSVGPSKTHESKVEKRFLGMCVGGGQGGGMGLDAPAHPSATIL